MKRNSIILWGLLFFISCQSEHPPSKYASPTLFFDKATQSQGFMIDSQKVGVWGYWHLNQVIEYKCITDSTISNKSMFFTQVNGTFYPLGVKINGKKEGLWLNYAPNGRIESYELFHLDNISKNATLETTQFQSGEVIIRGAKVEGRAMGLWLNYQGTRLKFVSSVENDKMSGVYIASPTVDADNYACCCAKKTLTGHMISVYPNNRIAGVYVFKAGEIVGLSENYDEAGNLESRALHLRDSTPILFGKDSGLIMMPTPPFPTGAWF